MYGLFVSLILGSIIYVSAGWLLHFTGQQETFVREKNKRLLTVIAWGNAGIITGMNSIVPEVSWSVFGECSSIFMCVGQVSAGLFAGGLLAAAAMDAAECYVYNYVWWWCLLWTVPVFGVSGKSPVAIVLFIILQQGLFARMYGRADAHAFCVCALAESVFGGGMLLYLIHMMLAVLLLAVVQLCRCNVMRNGRLKIPQPFVPYIVIVFWILMPGYLYLSYYA